ncbi:trimeric intracellular cation channel family protein [Bacillus taeanensis]|uniref:Trimeric intracellular cation channel family protein n=1 Tax=Bacillus taeanensis TaxID=273032 RepID=A0A366XU93_9BACI|nr:trimeric intracellular cation channel family protein [Bacillus taeanensis]RBW67713.1 trimeric intracellular cation channel family protein [Bacillus taeanensis]
MEHTWDLLNIIGTIAFAISGAIVAMEEDYDLLGAFILGLATAFGGGVVRNLLIGVPVETLWQQDGLLKLAIIVIAIVFFMPNGWIKHWRRWGNFFDALGLAAFAIQGALYAADMNHPISAVMVAAVLTGSGGGVIRDVLARRKPTVLQAEIYAVWAMLAGLVIGLGIATDIWHFYALFIIVVALRMFSVMYNWHLPRRSLRI